MKNPVYIIGGAQTDFQRNWTKEGKTFLAMFREVVEDALENTNLGLKEIASLSKKNKIGIFVGNFDGEQYFNQGHLGAFFTEINPVFYGIPGSRHEAACASGSVAIDSASSKIRAGDYDVAIVLGIELMKTVNSVICGDYLGTAAYYEKEAKGISFPFPKLFGQLADIYIEKYSINEKKYLDCLAEISTINYSNAKNNPLAQTRSWFMNKEHANNRNSKNNSLVGGKLAVTDCSQVTDGAAVVILSSKKYLHEYKTKRNLTSNNISEITGWGHRVAPVQFFEKLKESQNQAFVLPWTRQAVLDALKRANLKENNINLYETHDCFTSSEYAAISAFGITKPGKENEAIENGSIKFYGKNPINPSGGLIGCGHPVGATGVRMLLDLHKQITNNASGYQIKNVNNAMMLNIGGSATTNYVFIVSKIC
jgi:acetyl-CoA C-acetyltransferase